MFDFDADSGEIWLYDEFAPDWTGAIGTEAVSKALSAIGDKTAHVRFNTPGGVVDEALGIYSLLMNHKGGVVTYVDSLAASMGSFLLQAGKTRIVSETAMLMIHDPWGGTVGNARDHRKTAEVLDKYAQRMIPEYARRSGKSEKEIADMMAEETWLVGEEIVAAGFADKVEGDKKYKPVTKNLAKWAKCVPSALAEREADPEYVERFPLRVEAKAKRPLTIAEAKQMVARLGS